MIHEIAIEFAQSFSRSFLIVRTNVAGNLAAPKQVIANDDAADPQLWQTQIEIAAILFLHCIDENEIERFVELRNDFQRIAFFDLSAVAQSGASQITFRGFDHFVARIEGYYLSVRRHSAQQMDH